MKPSDMQLRFEELCAGHAIGDLTSEEVRELATLCQQLGASPDEWLDLLAAAVHADALEHSEATLPPDLAARLHQWAEMIPQMISRGIPKAVTTSSARGHRPGGNRLCT